MRSAQKRSEPETGPPAKTDEESASGRTDTLAELKGLVRRVHDEGDEGALPLLREILDEVPTLAKKLLDPAKQAEQSMVKNYAGDDPLVRETLPRTLKIMREELGGKDPSPLERLLVERVVATWLCLQYFEALYAQNIRMLTLQQSEYQQKRIDHAHRRHLSAVRTLAQVSQATQRTDHCSPDQHRREADQHGVLEGCRVVDELSRFSGEPDCLCDEPPVGRRRCSRGTPVPDENPHAR